jgi:DNA (cytosine-5)-methyltransferase 3A
VALERANVKVGTYYASEIDRHAIAVSQANYPDIIRLGDVKTIKGSDLPAIDMLLAGSPCQGFSKNGTGQGFDHRESCLFWEFIRILREVKPRYWLLENVRMKKEWSDVISKELGCEPILLNSSLVSAAVRERLYWTNIPYSGSPEDKELVIRDILELPITSNEGVRQQQIMVVGKSMAETYNGQANRIYGVNGKMATLGKKAQKIKIGEGDKGWLVPHYSKPVVNRDDWRLLTPVECERMQTLPDNYTSAISNKQRYMALGNGWTVDIIVHLLQGMKKRVCAE